MYNSSQEAKETVIIFKEECEEILNNFKNKFKEFMTERDPDILTKLLRDAHSIKGSAGIVGLESVQKHAHKTEDLLYVLKDNPNTLNNETFEEISWLINEIEYLIKNSEDDEEDYSVEDYINEMIKSISLLKADVTVADKLQKSVAELQRISMTDDAQDILVHVYNILEKVKYCDRIKDNNILNVLSGALKILKKILCFGSEDSQEELIFLKQRISVAEQMIDFFVVSKRVEPNAAKLTERNKTQKPELQNIFKNLEPGSIRTLRIETDKLDKLYATVFELGLFAEKSKVSYQKSLNITRKFSGKIFEFEKILTQIKHSVDKESKDCDHKKLLTTMQIQAMDIENNLKNIQSLMSEYEKADNEKQKQDKIFNENLNEIQNIIKSIRILPLGVILHMFPRMVRDIAKSENKEVEIEISGGETSVDKKILEEIKMPLIHLLRNAVDHGTELPEEREAQGKTRAGKITICAKNSGGNIVISVKDDGCGINLEKIKTKALEQKILDEKELQNYNREDLVNIIFKPGFTTEDRVTEISGRGIGLDIVNTKVSELKGSIKINTENGCGTEIIMEIPSRLKLQETEKITQAKPKFKESNFNLMIIDDSKTTKMYFKKILNEAGYNADGFDDAKTGLEALEKKHYDLLISDVEMPRMNGAELVLKIRKNKSIKDLPILIVSMLPMARASQLFKNIKIEALINKSDFNEDVFLATVTSMLTK